MMYMMRTWTVGLLGKCLEMWNVPSFPVDVRLFLSDWKIWSVLGVLMLLEEDILVNLWNAFSHNLVMEFLFLDVLEKNIIF